MLSAEKVLTTAPNSMAQLPYYHQLERNKKNDNTLLTKPKITQVFFGELIKY